MVFDGKQPLLELREVEKPAPRADEVLIKVEACGVCRTDLHVIDGDLKYPRLPLVPGHEIVGRVEEIGDGVAMISGLRDVRLDEVLRFEGGQFGFARVLDPELIGCVFIDAATKVEAGDTVFGTGEVVSVPVGDALLGPSRNLWLDHLRWQRFERVQKTE